MKKQTYNVEITVYWDCPNNNNDYTGSDDEYPVYIKNCSIGQFSAEYLKTELNIEPVRDISFGMVLFDEDRPEMLYVVTSVEIDGTVHVNNDSKTAFKLTNKIKVR